MHVNHLSYNEATYFSGFVIYFGGVRSKRFATLRNVSKLPFFEEVGQAKSVGFRFYSGI